MPRNPSTDPVTRRMLRHRFHARRPASSVRVTHRGTPPAARSRHANRDVAHPARAPAKTKKPRRASGRGQRNNHHL